MMPSGVGPNSSRNGSRQQRLSSENSVVDLRLSSHQTRGDLYTKAVRDRTPDPYGFPEQNTTPSPLHPAAIMLA